MGSQHLGRVRDKVSTKREERKRTDFWNYHVTDCKDPLTSVIIIYERLLFIESLHYKINRIYEKKLLIMKNSN